MSMRTFNINGYGLTTEDLAWIDDDKMAAFIRKHFPKMEFEGVNVNDIEDVKLLKYADCLEDNFLSNEGIFAAISNAMSAETGITFEYHAAGENGYGAILFCGAMPWMFNEAEKHLTEEKLDQIFKKYTDELGLDTTPCEVELEYFG